MTQGQVTSLTLTSKVRDNNIWLLWWLRQAISRAPGAVPRQHKWSINIFSIIIMSGCKRSHLDFVSSANSGKKQVRVGVAQVGESGRCGLKAWPTTYKLGLWVPSYSLRGQSSHLFMGVMTQTTYEVPVRASNTNTGGKQMATDGEGRQTVHQPKCHSRSLDHIRMHV